MEKVFTPCGRFSARGTFRTMEVGESIDIPRELAKPTTVRSTVSNLKADYGVGYSTMAIPEGLRVTRVK
jgi:hypothetical protein